MTGCAMKSEVTEADRIKTEGRQSLHRWRMSKISPIVNGAEESVGEENMVRQANSVNLAAAVHDHISCTKSAELRKISETKDGRMNLPLTDHMYANYSEKPKGLAMVAAVSAMPPEIRDMREIVLWHMDLFQRLEETIAYYKERLRKSEEARKKLQEIVEHYEERIDDWKNGQQPAGDSTKSSTEAKNDISETRPQPALEKRCVTKCCGRSHSKHLSRSLKRRNIVLANKAGPFKEPAVTSVPNKPPGSPSAENKDDETNVEANSTNVIKTPPAPVEPVIMNFNKPHKKRGRKPRVASWKDDYLHTDEPYYLPDFYAITSPLENAETTIEVPSWRHRPYPSFYQMEGTEDLDDNVFNKRHSKCEVDEKRRKKWDLQRMRDMKNFEKLSHKQCRGVTQSSRGKTRKKSISLYPNPNDIEYIEMTNVLPVIAFGQMIPVFQPSEFSLPWSVREPTEVSETPAKCKKSRTSICGQKVT